MANAGRTGRRRAMRLPRGDCSRRGGDPQRPVRWAEGRVCASAGRDQVLAHGPWLASDPEPIRGWSVCPWGGLPGTVPRLLDNGATGGETEGVTPDSPLPTRDLCAGCTQSRLAPPSGDQVGTMRRSVQTLSLLAAALAFLSRPARADEPRPTAPAQAVAFTRDIRPILQNCARCHGGVKRQGGLSFLRREDALAPARSGARAVVPGKPEESELLRRVTAGKGERMPPDGKPLPPQQVEALRRWIAGGAPWEPHWAFAPRRRLSPPAVRDTAWPRNEIDPFVLHRLEAHGLRPSPEADRYALFRRLHLDLTGLPPSLKDADAFLRDPSADAFEKAVDRLLASPQFGERWGRHWLDLARYADSDGYEVDKGRPHAWYWRDWVLRAVNEDLPFDQFTVEQLAGDLLPGATFGQRLATAFHRQTLTNNEGGIDREEYRVKAVLDRVHTTAAVWLGLTAGCAQCHDHPHDPLRQREFFELYALFNNADEADLPLTQEALAQFGWQEPRGAPPGKKGAKPQPVRLAVLAEREQPRTTYLFQRGDFL